MHSQARECALANRVTLWNWNVRLNHPIPNLEINSGAGGGEPNCVWRSTSYDKSLFFVDVCPCVYLYIEGISAKIVWCKASVLWKGNRYNNSYSVHEIVTSHVRAHTQIQCQNVSVTLRMNRIFFHVCKRAYRFLFRNQWCEQTEKVVIENEKKCKQRNPVTGSLGIWLR